MSDRILSSDEDGALSSLSNISNQDEPQDIDSSRHSKQSTSRREQNLKAIYSKSHSDDDSKEESSAPTQRTKKRNQRRRSLRSKKNAELTDNSTSLSVLSPRKLENAPIRNVSRRRRKRTANRVNLDDLNAMTTDPEQEASDKENADDDAKNDDDDEDTSINAKTWKSSNRQISRKRRRPRSQRDSKKESNDETVFKPKSKRRRIEASDHSDDAGDEVPEPEPSSATPTKKTKRKRRLFTPKPTPIRRLVKNKKVDVLVRKQWKSGYIWQTNIWEVSHGVSREHVIIRYEDEDPAKKRRVLKDIVLRKDSKQFKVAWNRRKNVSQNAG